jgi:hypothetical protein
MKAILRTGRIFLFILLLIIFTTELVLRGVRKEQWCKHDYPKIYVVDTAVGYMGVPNAKGHIRRPGIDKEFVLNNQGFYGPDFSTDKPDSIFRIMVTGASSVEGIWSDHRESFPMKLQKQFIEHGYRNIEVINCGISGSERDFQNLELLRRCAKLYNPDIVLHELNLNFVKSNYHRDTYKDYSILLCGNNRKEREHSRYIASNQVDLIKQKKLITDLWDISFLVRLYVRNANTNKRPSFANMLDVYVNNKAQSWQYYNFYTYNVEENFGLLDSLNEELKKNNCKLILFDYGKFPEDVLEKKKSDFPIIDLDLSSNTSIKYDGHMNEHGDEEIAMKLFRELSSCYIPFSPLK